MGDAKHSSNQDDQFFLALGGVFKRFPAKSISTICISILFIFGLAFQEGKRRSNMDNIMNNIQEMAAIEDAYRKHNIEKPTDNLDLVQLIQNFSTEISKKYLIENTSITKPASQLKQNGQKTRIVVVPFYVEQGREIDTGGKGLSLHYRRMSGFIENHLVAHHFEVVDPFAKENTEKELNQILERAAGDSVLASKDMCARYGVDAAYIVWLKMKIRVTADGYSKVSVLVDGKGFDSAGISLGANVLKTFKVTRLDSDEAIAVAEKEVGDVVGRALTKWKKIQTLSETLQKHTQSIHISLYQANDYERIEFFGKILNSRRGVLEARQLTLKVIPDNPQASSVEWIVKIDSNITDPFRLQANIMKIMKNIVDADGMTNEVNLIKGLRPGKATSRSIQFFIDRIACTQPG